jgi:lipopolysaccharide export system permease protein
MKKIDKLVLNSFIGPFILTFLVVVFILLMQHMLKYFDDLVGKDLGYDVLGQLLFYFAIFMTPVAMPLAVLLSSLITFGNLGEHFELTAIKSAGISLLRTLQPIFFFVLFLTGVAFYVNNNLVPKAALEAYSLLYDIKQKKPALELREGAFYVGIPDISIKINKKFKDDDAALKGVVIYDHRKNEGNKEVTIADSGRMYTILNERYLKLELFNGYNYSEGASKDQELVGQSGRTDGESLSRSKFSRTQVVFDLSSFSMERTDKKWFQGNRIMRNITQLNGDIDSMRNEVLGQRLEYFTNKVNYFSFFRRGEPLTFPPEVIRYSVRRDSIEEARMVQSRSDIISTGKNVPKAGANRNKNKKTPKKPLRTFNNPSEKLALARKQNSTIFTPRKTVTQKEAVVKPGEDVEEIKRRAIAATAHVNVKKNDPKKVKAKKINRDSLIRYKTDSVFNLPFNHETAQGVANAARTVKGQLESNNNNIENYNSEMRIFNIQWHKIIANSMACIAMFLIGAPLGAIIKKGGLGVPFLVSILFFIVYYVMNMIGEKWAKQGFIPVVTGVWGADLVLFIVGLLFLRQARADARLFEADFYLVVIEKFKRWLKERKSARQAGVSA